MTVIYNISKKVAWPLILMLSSKVALPAIIMLASVVTGLSSFLQMFLSNNPNSLSPPIETLETYLSKIFAVEGFGVNFLIFILSAQGVILAFNMLFMAYRNRENTQD